MKILITILLAITLVGFLFWTEPDSKAELQAIPVAQVVSTLVKQVDMRPSLTMTGKLQPARMVNLRFELNGQINGRYAEPGQKLSKDEVILSIADGDLIDRRNEALALLQQEEKDIVRDKKLLTLMRDEMAIQQREVNRLQQLGQKSLSSKSNYDAALRSLLNLQAQEANLNTSVANANSRMKTRQAMLNQMERDLKRAKLTAPFNATVNSIHYEVGDYAITGELAVELVQLEEMDLYLEVTGGVMSTLSMQQNIQVFADDKQQSGKIIAIELDPKQDTLTHGVRIRIRGDGLYSGQLAKAILPAQELKGVAVIPVSAILHEEGKAYVFQVVDKHLKQQEVELLSRQEDMQSIAGIDIGARIVTRDVAALADGQEVGLSSEVDLE